MNQWLRPGLQCRGTGSGSGQELGSHVPCGQNSQTIKEKQCCKKFNKELKNINKVPKKQVTDIFL